MSKKAKQDRHLRPGVRDHYLHLRASMDARIRAKIDETIADIAHHCGPIAYAEQKDGLAAVSPKSNLVF